jgi:hypothetical protein
LVLMISRPPADLALEQVRQQRPGGPLVWVVASDRWNTAVGVTDPVDHCGQDTGQLRGHQQQWHHFPGVGQPIRHEGEVGDLQQFLDPDPGVAQGLDDGPRPEGILLRAKELCGVAGCGVLHEHRRRTVLGGAAVGARLVGGAPVDSAVVVEGVAERRVAGGGEQAGLVGAMALGRVHQDGQMR